MKRRGTVMSKTIVSRPQGAVAIDAADILADLGSNVSVASTH